MSSLLDGDCGSCWEQRGTGIDDAEREERRACHILEQCADRHWLDMTPAEDAVFQWWDERQGQCPGKRTWKVGR